MDYRDLPATARSSTRSPASAWSSTSAPPRSTSTRSTLARTAGAGRAPAQPRHHPPAPHRRRGRRLLRALRLPRRGAAAPLAQPAGAGTGRLRHPPRRGLRRRLRGDAAPLGPQPRRQPRARRSGSPGPERVRVWRLYLRAARNGFEIRLHLDLPGPLRARLERAPMGNAARDQRPARRLRREPRSSSRSCAPRVRRRLADRRRRRRRARRRRRVGAASCWPARFAKVVWVPGQPRAAGRTRDDPVQLRGEARYRHLVELCRELGVLTPEDPYPRLGRAPAGRRWSRRCSCSTTTRSGRRAPGDQGGGAARAPTRPGWSAPTSSCCTPTPTRREAWCGPGWRATERRLARLPAGPADRAGQPLPAGARARPGSCATRSSRSGAGPTRDRRLAPALPAPPPSSTAICTSRVTTWHDGVRFEEVSLGYPREWAAARGHARALRRILPRRRWPA